MKILTRTTARGPKPEDNWSAGDTIEVSPERAEILIRAGVAVKAERDKPKPIERETAAIETDTEEKAIQPPVQHKRRGPR